MGKFNRSRKGLAALTLAGLSFSGLTACSKDDEQNPSEQPGEVIEIAGVSGPVTVTFDADSVPHIKCKTADDCYLALGYLHARDRYIQMEVRRSFVRGRLHRLLPSMVSLAGPIDQANRLRFLTRDAKPIEVAALEHASDESISLLEAYSAGVNAWLGTARASSERLFSDEFYFSLVSRDHILDWEKEDSIAAVVALVDSLTNSVDDEIRNAENLALYGDDLFNDLIFPRPVSDALTLFESAQPKSASAGVVSTPNLANYGRALRQAAETAANRGRLLGDFGEVGSNNWVVGPTRSASGNALLSDDPHLTHTNPATWYVVEMEAEDGSLHVAGVTFAGLPWVILGQNKDIAWGATTTYFDQTDVYLETLNDDCDAVIFNGEEVPMIAFDNTVSIGGQSVERFDWVVPHHGPVVSIDCDAKTAISFRWTGQDLSSDVNFLNELSRAKNVDEAREALRMVTTLGQNWVVIDTQGGFGWYPYNALPVRGSNGDTYHPALPFPGDGSAEWIGTIPYDELPQMHNPEEGYITTANNDMTGELYNGLRQATVPRFQSEAADGLRQERIHELLAGSTEHTQETMLSTVGDTYMKLSEYVVPHVLDAIEEHEEPGEKALLVRDILTNWDGTCPTGLATSDPTGAASEDAQARSEAQGCLVFHRLVNDLRTGIFGDEIAAAGGTNRAALAALTDILTENSRLAGGAAYYDDVTTDGVETREDIIVRASNATVDWITAKLGEDTDNWLWGRLHRLTLLADLFPEFNVNNFNNGAYAYEGGLSTVNVAAPSQNPNDGFDGRAGASMRFICEGFPEGMKCTIQIPGGQRHFRDSEYYANFLERWLTNTPTPLLFNQTIDNPIEVVRIQAP